MKFLILLAILSTMLSCTLSTFLDMQDAALLADRKWQRFKSIHGKKYKNMAEERKRRAIWLENSKFIENHNLGFKNGKSTFDCGMNDFGDMTNEEFNEVITVCKPTHFNMFLSNLNTNVFKPKSFKIPKLVDWRMKGIVSPVKNQGKCGSCWAFSAVASLESQWALKTGNLVNLSEQNLVDCADQKYGNFGCQGGWMNSAFTYIKNNKGVATEASYPYTAKQGSCKYSGKTVGARIQEYVTIPNGNENALLNAVASVGPVSVAMNFGSRKMQFYRSGIFSDPTCNKKNLNHAVTVIGYNESDKGSYYIVKNSWGVSWGENGLLFLNIGANECGVAAVASYPIV